MKNKNVWQAIKFTLFSASAGLIQLISFACPNLLAPFSLWRPVIPFSVALLRCISLPLARRKNTLRILGHSQLKIGLL